MKTLVLLLVLFAAACGPTQSGSVSSQRVQVQHSAEYADCSYDWDYQIWVGCCDASCEPNGGGGGSWGGGGGGSFDPPPSSCYCRQGWYITVCPQGNCAVGGSAGARQYCDVDEASLAADACRSASGGEVSFCTMQVTDC